MASFLEHARRPAWGVKDPRLLLTFDLWRPYFEALPQTTYVFIHRPFAASVRSLPFRDGFWTIRSHTWPHSTPGWARKATTMWNW